ncbi:hypothetical protein [Staphylococcus marylandisciuri]|uniref:hypothetical protein n=1 Tax=Staphylococcus marylandisciuri TaxID=2981529 RepID=UPI0021D216A6|nr:hypothetical protein [Staphylococcus marylandisciuri]
MPGRDYEIILFKLDFCPAPLKHCGLGWKSKAIQYEVLIIKKYSDELSQII